jgi:putative ABC transport system permease protein
VARHVKHYGVDQPSRVELYIPAAQRSSTGGWLVLRTARDPASLAPAMREAVKSINPNVPLFAVRPMEEIVSDSTAPRRLSVLLLGAFAALALVLAAIGIYGVMSYFVIQRSHEIGIRMALGAQREDILRLVVRQGLGLAALGLAIGLGASLYLSRFLTTQLFGVQTKDAGTYATIPLLLALVALAACYIPARRATKVDPMLALRYE